ncbi:MAG: hypothetical protein IJV39_05760 [Ruminococcus sp.]|nr:hypothetical protein [Ruminococcus sp.]
MKKKNTINLVLSAFLVIAYVVCTYFFSTIGLTGNAQKVCNIIITIVFGLVLFYATRVGEGKSVRRLSIATFIILDLPAIYILLTNIATSLPLADVLGSSNIVVMLAGVALGYGIPYTFLSGFELEQESDDEDSTEDADEFEEAEGDETDVEETEADEADVDETEADEAEEAATDDPVVEINL